MKAILPDINGGDAEVNAFALSSREREKCRDKKMINFSLLFLELPFRGKIHFHMKNVSFSSVTNYDPHNAPCLITIYPSLLKINYCWCKIFKCK